MLTKRFGVEIEFTGITRKEASKIVSDYLGGIVEETRDGYDTKKVIAPDNRVWKLMSDGSLRCEE